MKKFLILNILIILFMPSSVFAGHKEGHPLSKSQEKKYERRMPEIKKMDLNKDGILQQNEIEKGVKSKFEALDTNKDGVISADEQSAGIAAFKKDKAELYGTFIEMRIRRLENRMRNADKNKDGVISSEEYEAYFGARYKNMDKDKDGILSIREFRTDVEHVHKRR